MTPEQIKKIYRGLPDEMKDFVGSEEVSVIDDGIAKTYSLQIEQRRNLGDEVTLRLLGVTKGEELLGNIQTRLNISADVAAQISKDIDSKILSKIPANVLKAHDEYVQAGKLDISSPATTQSIEIPAEGLPMVEPGEAAHDTTPEEKAWMQGFKPEPRGAATFVAPTIAVKAEEKPAPAAVGAYPGGKDPYREPLD